MCSVMLRPVIPQADPVQSIVTANVDQPVTLEIQLINQGYPDIFENGTIVWTKDGRPLPENPVPRLSNFSRTLKFDHFQLSLLGRYTAYLCNFANCSTATILLRDSGECSVDRRAAASLPYA